MITANDIGILLSIARAGSDYEAIKRLLAETQWEIEEDEVDLGFLRIFIHDTSGECYRLIIGYRDPDHPPYFLLTFSVVPELEKHVTAFNASFWSAAEMLTRYFGAPTVSGDRHFSFRSWPYAYHRWSLPEGEFTLVQDEFDIQEGMDVTLWMHPVGTSLDEVVRE
ncbi:hypothetical protein [Pedosphaera parvula]|uniref:Uncharacterized protein n=1 Tax=Pedosphaera parvula (strain Ellin514) TaxID=320771 RepID=B9XGX4_PEDPL|nr:hypothetical protein [Pedosphaera parvula]EEF60895.1 hypothetical protein Cflav_PD4064 [Pedosphaera parvula Ellin514]